MPIPILNCTKLFKFRCPKNWSSMEGKQGDRVRYCQSCKKNVYLCETPEEVHIQAQIGACIAIVAKERDSDRVASFMGEADPDVEIEVLEVLDEEHLPDESGESSGQPEK